MERRRTKIEPPESLVALTIRVHPDARRRLKVSAAMDDMTMEEKARVLLYGGLRVDHPIVVETASANASA